MSWRLGTVLAIVAAAILTALAVQVVSAGSHLTNTKCDPDFKYHCAAVYFWDQGPEQWKVDARYYQGAIDGGAKRWLMSTINDWERPLGGYWHLTRAWGDPLWRTNVSMSPVYWDGGDHIVVRESYVYFTFKFYEEIPGQSYYWYGKIECDLWVTPATAACRQVI
jgi:hypothetical protein